MKSVLLIGLGRFGTNLAKKLGEFRCEILAVDRNEKCVNLSMPYVTNAMIGDAADAAFLKSLGVSEFDICIVGIGEDFKSSLEVTSMLKEFGAKFVISRASSDFHEKFLKRNGADQVVYPEKQMADWTAIVYSSEKILGYAALGGKHGIFEMEIPADWIGRQVSDLDLRRKFDVNIVGIKTYLDINVNVNGDTLIPKESTLLILATEENIKRCFKL